MTEQQHHDEQHELRRIVRRELTRSRSLTAVILALVLLLGSLAAGAVVLLYLSGNSALNSVVPSPVELATRLANLPTLFLPAGLIGMGVIAALIGLLLVVVALKPGRKAYHAVAESRIAALVDNTVIASALAAFTRGFAQLSPGQVVASVSGKQARVDVTPISGGTLDAQAIQTYLTQEVAGWGLEPQLEIRVQVRTRAAVGA